jgi:hypothetical protein
MQVFTDLSALPVFKNAVLTVGSFDGVHSGHRRLLDKVRSLAQARGGVSVVVTFDPHPRAVLQPGQADFKLLNTTAEKIALLEAAGVDCLVIVPFSPAFAQQSAQAYVADFLVAKFRPNCIVIGYDHRFGAGREGDIAFLKQQAAPYGFEVLEIPAQEVDDIAVSSSKIRKALTNNDIRGANRLLGYAYQFAGRVVEGQRIGRSIGFPTANIAPQSPQKLLPPPGIYAARAWPEGSTAAYEAMLYIGNRPTLEGPDTQTIEVNLLDFDGDLYGQELRVEVVDFIRHDKKLDGLAALQAEIEADKAVIVQRLRQPAAAEKVAVVILNYNTRRHLERYLPSVLAHSPGAEVVVADNGSPDDSLEFLRHAHPGLRVLDLQRNHGFAQGYNEALRQVQADVYVILNSDVEVTAGWLDPVLEAMRRDPTIAIAQPKILAWNERRRFEYAGAAGGWIDFLGYPFCRGRVFHHREEDTGQYDAPQACFWAAGAAFFVRAELYHTFGGFDSDYFAHNEEIDLCWRLKRAGYGVHCIPQSVVYHLGGGTLEYESPRKVFLNFRNSLYSLLKNEPAGKLLWLLPARLLLDGLAGARFAAKGQFRAIWAIVRAHFSFYGNFRNTLRKRRIASETIESQRIAPPNMAGVYPRSIIVAHYAHRVKEFSKLFQP